MVEGAGPHSRPAGLLPQRYAEIATSGIFPHKLRHVCATEYLRNGGGLFVPRKLIGHATLDMSRHYAQLADDDVDRETQAHSPVEGLALKL